MDVYFPQDVLRVLRAVYVANEGARALGLSLGENEQVADAYRRGFQTALVCVGLAVGLVASDDGDLPPVRLPTESEVVNER